MDVNPYDRDDLAAFALDALDTDELKAFDARLDGARPAGAWSEADVSTWREALGLLATAASADLSPAARTAGVDLSRARRAPGIPLHDVEISARSAFELTVRDLGDLLDALGPADWSASAVEGWTVKGLLAHLVATDAYFGHQLGLWELDVDAELEPDHLGLSRPFVAASEHEPAAALLAAWRERTNAILVHLAGLDDSALRRPMRFHFLHTSLSTILVTRVFEMWTHEEDICRATGRSLPTPDPARLRRMSRIAVPSMPFGLAFSGVPVSGRTARIVLTGPGGGTWDQALAVGEVAGAPDVTLVLDVVDYCRLASRRIAPDEVAVDIEGDAALGRHVLVGAGVFSA